MEGERGVSWKEKPEVKERRGDGHGAGEGGGIQKQVNCIRMVATEM